MKLNKIDKDRIINYFELGLPVSDICSLMGFSVSELHELITSDKQLANAKLIGAKKANIKVIEALLKASIGYNAVEEDVIEIKGRNNAVINTTSTRREKHIAPNIQAIKYWLDNRAGADWKDNIKDVEKNLNIKISVDGKDINII